MRTVDLPEVLRRHVETLRQAGVPSPEVDVRLLAAHALGEDEHRLGGVAPDSGAIERLADLVAKRAERVPVQHLVGASWFRHVQLQCRPGVFIPRPETEIVAGLAIDAAKQAQRPLVIEPCTGTGAIAASLVAEVPGVRVVATDRTVAAVQLARENLARVVHGAAGVAACRDVVWDVLGGDLFGPIDVSLQGEVDVVVANPPYMPARDRATWDPEVALHDPPDATIGGEDGHEVVTRLLTEARSWLRDGGTLVCEIDERRGPEAADLARVLGYEGVRVERDLTGAHRAVVGSWTSGRDTEELT